MRKVRGAGNHNRYDAHIALVHQRPVLLRGGRAKESEAVAASCPWFVDAQGEVSRASLKVQSKAHEETAGSTHLAHIYAAH